ncbi:WD40 repeat-like protein [Flagelloscypha sp. PMI_526]|nr:WD40 repeat-like protein [Flagelloscypha sp. PMI_526]
MMRVFPTHYDPLLNFERAHLSNLNRRRDLCALYQKPLDRDSELEGHTGCVNALSWAQDGNLLLSGGDDTTVRIWRMSECSVDDQPFYPFKTTTVIRTGHRDNIFGVACLPHSTRIATVARDRQVRVFDIGSYGSSTKDPVTTYSTSEAVTHILRCHRESVKRIATEDNPDRFLTVSEVVRSIPRQHDLRTAHSCTSRCPEPLMRSPFDLSTLSTSPVVPYYFLIAGESSYGFLFDRRHIRDIRREWGQVPGLNSETVTNCVIRFGRPTKTDSNSRFGTHVTGCRLSRFNGHEALLSYSGDAVYSYSTKDSPVEPSKRTSSTISLGSPSRKRRKIETESPRNSTSNLGDTFEELQPLLGDQPDAQDCWDAADLSERQDVDEDSEHESDSSEGGWDLNSEDSVMGAGVPVIMPRLRCAGARNIRTVKDVNFVGPRDDYIASGSDDGNFFLWKKTDGKLHYIGEGDGTVLPLLAVSGIDHSVKVWYSREQATAERIIETNARPEPMLTLSRSALMRLLTAAEESGEEPACANQ